MLATDPTTELESKPAAKPSLEEQATNEAMRHIPTIGWMCEKLDGDLRRRIEKLCAPLESQMTPEAESELRALCRALDRVADTAKHIRSNGHGPNEVLQKVRWSMNHAVSCMRLVDTATFGRRAPFHHFEKSKSEALYGALLVVIVHTDRLTRVVRTIDPGIDERLCEGLVHLTQPLREQPIA
jgi:hypothetical protein